MSYGKRKHPGPTGQGIAKPFDATGTYSARDMQALNATFANPEQAASAPPEKAKGAATAEQWTCGQVPPLAPMTEGGDRKEPQIAYARTLLTVFQEAVNQMATVVKNLEQIQTQKVWPEVVRALLRSCRKSNHRTRTKLLRQGSSSRTHISEREQDVGCT